MKTLERVLLSVLGIFVGAIVLLIASVFIRVEMKEAAVRSELTSGLKREFKKLGYTGQVKVTGHRDNWFSDTTVSYSYREKVKGRWLEFKGLLEYDGYGTYVPYNVEEPVGFEGEELESDDEIKYTAMWKQVRVEKKLNHVKQTFRKVEDKNLRVKEVGGFLTASLYKSDKETKWDDVLADQQEILATFEKNQRQKSPVNGYYDVDVQRYLKRHVLQIEINLELKIADLDEFELEDDFKYQRRFIKKLKSVNYSDFWDGYYVAYFSLRDRFGRISRFSWNGVVLDIQNGKLVRIFDVW